MPEYPTSAPAAGWYTDPSDPNQERWWGGVEWTHDVRPLAAAVPAYAQQQPAYAQQPALANVPGGGINPFAVIDAEEASRNAAAYGGAAQVTSNFSTFDGFDPSAQSGFAVSPGWYDPNRRGAPRPAPTNGVATAGLVLSLLGANLFGIIFSVIGLRKANEFEAQGDLPIGRKRARWGLGLGIASAVISIMLIAVYVFAFQYFVDFARQNGLDTSQADDGFTIEPDTTTDESAPASDDDGTYDKQDYEQAIFDEYAADGYPTPDSVTCPATGSTAPGGQIICTIITDNLIETRTADYFENGGYSISTVSTSQ